MDMAFSTTQTVISCTTSTASHCSSGTQVQPAKIRHKSLQKRAAAFMRSSFKKPAIMLRQSQTSSSRTQAKPILSSCSTGTRKSPTPRSVSLQRLRQAKTRGVWQLLLIVDSCAVLLHSRSLSAQYTSAMLRPRNTMPRLTHSDVFMLTWFSTTSTSVGRWEGEGGGGGGDFNMSALSTVGDVFTDPEFSAPGDSLLWGSRCFGQLVSRMHRVSHYVQAPA